MQHSMPVRLIALDIDGTLLDPGVHHSTLPTTQLQQAVSRLHDVGIEVALASGRMYPGTHRVAQHLGITLPLICQQGASVHEHDGSLRYGYNIDDGIARELLEYGTSNGWTVAWFDPHRYLVTAESAAARYFADVSGIEMEVHPEPHLSGVRATGIDIVSTPQESSQVHAAIEKRYGDELCLLDFTSVTAVHAREASKGNSLSLLAQELDIAQGDVLAIGDSINDASMLSWAGHSAAPEHCDAAARATAKRILPGDGISGVIALLESVASNDYS